ncbi:MAG: hypothetical protein K8T90_03055 [Planctomycetes bacterium]|nr:hypothetical protein [Planctomycetota bacterium]
MRSIDTLRPPLRNALKRVALVTGLVALASVAAAQDQPAPPDKPVAPQAPDAPGQPSPPPSPTPTPPATPPRRAPGAPSNGGPPNPPQGSAREAMWPAPTAEDWKKPCLITWQRSWEDAQAVSKETGKAVLVCINMDGEIASEHYAGVRYRQPETAAMYEPYVCVIASVYRHTPRDYDDQGRRIPCPRFGGVTCGEHIALEPIVYEKYLDGQRVAPRHIGVELDGKEMYDVYYANDTASVFKQIRDGVAGRATPPVVVRSDRPVVERVASHDVADRAAVESGYEKGDAATRKALLEAALARGGAAPLDLLRLAVFGFDVEMSRLARAALAKSESPDATNLIVEAMRVPMEPAERDALIAALGRLGTASPRAKWLATVYQGLSNRPTVEAKDWARVRESSAPQDPKPEWRTIQDRWDVASAAARAKPDDALAQLDLAEAALALAVDTPKSLADDPKASRFFTRHMLEDARVAATEAERLGAATGPTSWRVNGVLALAAYYGGDTATAYVRAEPAMKAMPAGEYGWNSMAVITVFAESRWKAIQKAVREKQPWPPQYLADLHGAYSVLLRHPRATDSQVLWHYDFLGWLGATDQQARILDEAMARFPASQLLHDRLRIRTLREKGPEALEAAYDALLAKPDAPAAMQWFAAKAYVVAAESHRRGLRPQQASAAYDKAVARYDRAIELDPDRRTDGDPAVALAMAGRSRLAYQAGDDDRALAEILQSFERSPKTAGTRDGVGITPAETAQMLLARLRVQKREAEEKRLFDAMSKLDPELLAPDRP